MRTLWQIATLPLRAIGWGVVFALLTLMSACEVKVRIGSPAQQTCHAPEVLT